jgi:gas vesicle protein
MKKFGNFIIGAMLGGILGASIAMLIAPSSGKNLRELAQGTIQKFFSEIELAATEKRKELEDELTRLRSPEA